MKTVGLFSFVIILNTLFGFGIVESSELKIPTLEIRDGLYEHGERILKLTHEGLLIRSVCINCKGYENNIKFINRNELRMDKIITLNEYLKNNDHFQSFDHEYLHDGNALVVPRVYLLKIPETNCEKEILDFDYLGNYNSIHNLERRKLDSLVLLMNDIIPRKYFDHYSIHVYHK